MKSEIIFDYKNRIVIKKCRTHFEYLKEIEIYKKGFSFIPKFFVEIDNLSFSIQLIAGKTIGEIDNPDFSKLGKIFGKLHSHKNREYFSICHNDTNPKNYLVDKNGNYFMIDFSDWTYDYQEKDIIHFLLFWASIYSRKKFEYSVETFIKSYQKRENLNPEIWKKYFDQIKIKFDERRKLFGKKEILPPDVLKTNRNFLKNII